jgi:hypothetical protein
MDDGWGGLVGFLCLIGIGVAIWWWGFDTLWYTVEYWVPPSAVNIAPRPTDCDFWRAPVGTKACHYERKVYGQLIGGGLYDADLGLVSNSITGVQNKLDPHADFDSVWVSWTKKTNE